MKTFLACLVGVLVGAAIGVVSAQNIVPLDTSQPTTILYGQPEIRSFTVACITVTKTAEVRLEYKERTARQFPIPAYIDICGELALIQQGAKLPVRVETPHAH